MGEIHIRHALPGDADRLAALYGELVRNHTRIDIVPSRLVEIADDKNNLLVVAERQGQLAGTAMLTLCLDAMYRRQPFGLVENVVVAEKARGRGVGRALMQILDDVALQHDCSKLMLLSAAFRHDAHRFFGACHYDGDAKQGFVKYRRNFDPRLA